MNFLEKDKRYFAHRIFNTQVLFENPEYSVKFYDYLFTKERRLESSVIVECDLRTCALAPTIAVPIKPYDFSMHEDDAFVHLAKYLSTIAECESTRIEIQTAFRSSRKTSL